ncbi:hypothetical protein ACK3SF_05535 [Candidatus Nanosalina sp. VS9-1]|uniref:hypothetical protein n=1 Tax=Candidatus Nanosalina sp. VS9-1 TaxID=3388566 RepID=UPI0039DF3612
MRKRAENDPLEIDPGWEDLLEGLESRNSLTCAQLIVYGVDTNYPLGPGTIVRKAFKSDGKLPVEHSLEKIFEEMSSEFGNKVTQRVEKILEKNLDLNSLKVLKFDMEVLNELRYGTVDGVSGKWKRMTSGGTWTIYTDRQDSKVLKASHTAENSWETAILALTHEEVAERIEQLPEKYRLGAPKNRSVAVAEVDGEKFAVTTMEYEKNYVEPGSNREGLEEACKVLKRMFESGELPAHEFDYDREGLKRRNMAYRDGKFIALDLCDKSVLGNEEFLRENGIIEKAQELGFSNGSGFLGGLFGKFR